MKLPLTPSLANFSWKKNLNGSGATWVSALLALLALFSVIEPVFDENDGDWASGGIAGENVVGEGPGEPLTRC